MSFTTKNGVRRPDIITWRKEAEARYAAEFKRLFGIELVYVFTRFRGMDFNAFRHHLRADATASWKPLALERGGPEGLALVELLFSDGLTPKQPPAASATKAKAKKPSRFSNLFADEPRDEPEEAEQPVAPPPSRFSKLFD